MKTNIEIKEAISLIVSHTPRLAAEQVPAADAHGRVLAADVTASIDQPPWPRSPLDGYALRAADTEGADRNNPVTLDVVDRIFAGDIPHAPVLPGQAARIMTGAPIPPDCDCVIRQEDTDLGEECVQLFAQVGPYQNYCYPGEDFHAGDVLLRAGTRLAGAAMGVLAAAGLLRDDVLLPVVKQPRCALLCTGDELAPQTQQPLQPGKIYSSNAAHLAARLHELGIAVTEVCETFPDDAEALAEKIRNLEGRADCIITAGGVSVGEKDILHETLPLLGAEVLFKRVRVKPGAPLIFALSHCPVLALSGNPFAAGATFEVFARPMLAKLAGSDDLLPLWAEAELGTAFRKGQNVPRLVRGVYRDGIVTLPEGHASGVLASAAGTNCLVQVPEDGKPVPAGSRVKVWML